ncbi:hypothetical protein AX17_003764 [Amanita inopinata Kibby_2008]|nr:hypothetical protein AX17_003764 [Amanita inopinata Kibby_2008]
MPFTSNLKPEHQELLSSSIEHPAPFCSGTFPVSPADFIIYYRKEDNARWLNLLNPSVDSLKRLAEDCDPATFGVGHEDVYDESYRKAGKLGSNAFRPVFDPTNLGLLHILRESLLRGVESQRPIRAELHSMNVYGEGSFFKAHKDTPRSEWMFGSLVIFYPTPHEGGALIMRKDDQEWMFESSKELAELNEPHVGYVALYSDVEHEVALVTSGYRVTITYNLYFDEAIPNALESVSADALALKTAFQGLLDDPEFLPNGGYLGFGLEYEYPLPAAYKPLSDLEDCLKGSDAKTMHIIKELSLDVSLWGLIEGNDFKVLCEEYFPRYGDGHVDETECLADCLYGEHVKVIEYPEPTELFEVNWITEPTSLNQEPNTYIAYGNQPSIEYAYHNICMIVWIGKPGERTKHRVSK